MSEHYHVVEFINGCLNDYDSGPIETLDDARSHLAEFRDREFGYGDDDEPVYVPAGEDRYESDVRILTIETCTHDECKAEV